MATNKVYCSYQEIVDMHTETNHATAIGIHTPVGDTPRKMFSGFFDQFKKYKYLGCSISFVPVATLPADPSQIAIEGGDYSIDPRDLVNPIMFHGCHGDDMGTILNKLYGDGAGISESMDGIDYTPILGDLISNEESESLAKLYYKALTDNTWKKAHPQKGFRKSGLKPLVYQVATNRQIMPNNFKNTMHLGDDGKPILEMGDATSDYDSETGINDINLNTVQFFTPKLTGLGWMDTRMALTNPSIVDVSAQSGTSTEKLEKAYYKALNDQIRYSELPKLYMGVILLAPAYKTELYFRVIFNHHFAFKDFRGISFKPEVTGIPSYTDATDDLFDPVTYPEVDFDGGSGSDPEPEPITSVQTAITLTNGRGTNAYLQVIVNPDDDDPLTLTSGVISANGGTWSPQTVNYAVGTKLRFNCNISGVDYYTDYVITDSFASVLLTSTISGYAWSDVVVTEVI